MFTYVVMPDGTVEFITEDNSTQEIAHAIQEYTHGLGNEEE